jgi:hypothetical protein
LVHRTLTTRWSGLAATGSNVPWIFIFGCLGDLAQRNRIPTRCHRPTRGRRPSPFCLVLRGY